MRPITVPLLALAPLHAAELVVGTASDLAPFSDQLAKGFRAAQLRFSLASGGSLKQQIENSAPFDVFLFRE